MEASQLVVVGLIVLLGGGGAFLFWRYVWFFRNPSRTPPAEEGLVSPADGTVVYVKQVGPYQDVVTIKQGLKATVRDLLREDEPSPKLVIGIFMSPFAVHYNRAPLDGRVEMILHHPAVTRNHHMGAMHWRTVLNKLPLYENSVHIVENERKVTRLSGVYRDAPLACYVVQIAGGSVDGIDSYVQEGQNVARGAVFGMIRIGSQVDLIVPWREGLRARVRPGDKVKAGETIVIG